ncbi:hypothetical protein Mapa_015291 [Marchantia paleacea]|nr:hypothetical protein Mapa_015291 [Marchantia paleacea]
MICSRTAVAREIESTSSLQAFDEICHAAAWEHLSVSQTSQAAKRGVDERLTKLHRIAVVSSTRKFWNRCRG